MKQAISFLFCITLLSNFNARSQTVKIISASEQKWAGGAAGRTGTYNHFEIEFKGFKNEPLPDTIWIGQEAIPLVITDAKEAPTGNTIRTKTKKSIKFQIKVGTAHNEYAELNPQVGPNEKKIALPKPPVKYKGVALLSYKNKGHETYFTIPKYTIKPDQANYP